MIRRTVTQKESIFGFPTTKKEKDYVPTEKIFGYFVCFLRKRNYMEVWGKEKNFSPPLLA